MFLRALLDSVRSWSYIDKLGGVLGYCEPLRDYYRPKQLLYCYASLIGLMDKVLIYDRNERYH